MALAISGLRVALDFGKRGMAGDRCNLMGGASDLGEPSGRGFA